MFMGVNRYHTPVSWNARGGYVPEFDPYASHAPNVTLVFLLNYSWVHSGAWSVTKYVSLSPF